LIVAIVVSACISARKTMKFMISIPFAALLVVSAYPDQISAFTVPPSSNNRIAAATTSRSNVVRSVLEKNPVTAASDDGSSSIQKDDDASEAWWKHHKMEHSDLAERIRGDFSILQTTTIGDEKKPLIYLDSAATSQKPKQVIDALDEYYTKNNSNVHRGAHTLSRQATAAYEDARDSIQRFINASSRNEIVYTGGATEALNLVANSYGIANIKAGDEIVFSEMEHHANLVPWQILSQRTGAKLRFAKLNKESGGLDIEQMESLLNENTKLVAFPHVSNVLACINPVKEIVAMVRSKCPDAKIVLDACQSVPHMKVDVQDLGVDFLAASGHKMCAPTGIGFLWGKEDLLNSMPPYQSGGEMIDHVTMESATYAKSPARFEAGTPAIAQAVGLGAAIKYLEGIGMDKVEKYEHELAEYLHKRMSEVEGVSTLGPPVGVERAAICAFTVDGIHPSDLSTFLDMEGVAVRAGHHCCQPLHQTLGISHSARASLYIYNTKEDIDQFIEKLKSTIGFFANLSSNEETGADDDFVPFI